MTITEFLMARIAEDEAVAREVRPDEHLRTRDSSTIEQGSEMGYSHVSATSGRVLAECEAKRRIIELRYSWDLQAGKAPEEFKSILRTQVVTADTVLRTLAAVYADHPNYDETWRV